MACGSALDNSTTLYQAATAASDPQSAPFVLTEPSLEAWNAFTTHHPHGHLLQCAPWGSLKASFGWQVQRIAVTEQPAGPPAAPGPILAGAQVLFRTRYGVSAAYVPRCPLWSDNPDVDNLLLSGLLRAARKRWAIFVRFEPNILEEIPKAATWHSWLLLNNFRVAVPIQPRSTVHVDLTPSPDQIFAGFSKGHRADIRRAERDGVTVRVGTADDMAAFHAIMRDTGQRAEFGIHTAAYYQLAWECFQPRSRLLLAEQAGQPVAGHLVLADKHYGYYLYSGATPAGLKAGANHLLQWHALQWARDLGCQGYDLWGIPDALGQAASSDDPQQRAQLEEAAQHDPLIGVYRFKKGFGGRVVRYLPAYDRVFFLPLYAIWRRRMRS